MKKQILFLLVLLSFSMAAQAGVPKNQKEINDERLKLAAQEIAREEKQAEYAQKNYEELQKSNQLNTEILEKLGKLYESSEKNNVLMKTLLKRTE